MTPSDDSTRAAALHRDAIIIDGHSDILMAIADRKMRLGERVELPPHEGGSRRWVGPTARRASSTTSPHTAYFQTMGHYDLPRFLDGGLTAQGWRSTSTATTSIGRSTDAGDDLLAAARS